MMHLLCVSRFSRIAVAIYVCSHATIALGFSDSRQQRLSSRGIPESLETKLNSTPLPRIRLQRRSSRLLSSKSSSPSTEGPDRFRRKANLEQSSEQECLLQIDHQWYNLTAWARAHPGGVKVLQKFHRQDATEAFGNVGHSPSARQLLQTFAVGASHHDVTISNGTKLSKNTTMQSPMPRWRQKLFTREDPFNIHKFLGIVCLLHFAYRFGHVYFGDPSGGFGRTRGSHWSAALCLSPHLLLSLSSLLFNTVPRERVVGKPMIWQEYRIHNIAFAVRSIVCTGLMWLSAFHRHATRWRHVAVVGCCSTALATSILADVATHRLRTNPLESTTATMPYWDGCSPQTELNFKTFYAFSQFMATIVCMAACNPAWAFTSLFAIQGASLLMTLVRKGFLSTKGSHMVYTAMLIMPYMGGLRSMMFMRPLEMPLLFGVAGILFQLRRLGVNKYVLWVPIYVLRVLYGDRFLPYQQW